MHRTAPSVIHFASLDEINDPTVGNTELYGRSKVAIILGVKYGLLERVIKPNNDNIYVLSVHPGAVSLVICLSMSFEASNPNADIEQRSTLQCSSSGRMPTPGSSARSSRR
jgi:hypothetical protein